MSSKLSRVNKDVPRCPFLVLPIRERTTNSQYGYNNKMIFRSDLQDLTGNGERKTGNGISG